MVREVVFGGVIISSCTILPTAPGPDISAKLFYVLPQYLISRLSVPILLDTNTHYFCHHAFLENLTRHGLVVEHNV
jgi:hypothetical protein